MAEPEEGSMPLTSHLYELRRRLIISVIAILVGFIVSYAFSEPLFQLLAAPLVEVLPEGTTSLVFIGIIEPFFTYLKVAVVAGIVLASPVILYQVWAFAAPALYKGERRWFLPIVLISTLFFLLGLIFAYKVVFPFGFKYLMGFANAELRPELSIALYFSVAIKLLLAFGIVFEIPFFMTILARIGVTNAAFFSHYRRYAIVIAVVLSALLTPPDIFSQLMMAGPVILLYELGILGAKVFGKKEPSSDETEDKDSEG
ncbi:MAG: twin-arginine translocase subunit TatC [Deltaproteobacteria bacterium]|nr:twin-arginine translocase subunit TatC [Deltaproteobacteria bacterium]